MFEIPDDDSFWDDFSLEEDSNLGPGNTTSKPSAESASVTQGICGNADDGLDADSKKPNNVDRLDPVLSKASGSNKRRSQRKFPGPAGLLPAMLPLGQLSCSPVELVGVNPSSSTKETNAVMDDSLTPSLSQSDDVSSSLQWKQMMEDLGDDAQTLLNKFSIKSLLLRASRKMLGKGKAPLVFGVIETMDLQGADAGFVIRDQTGRMKGSLHKDLIQDPSTALQAGCVLILRQVSVISPSSRTHYLNVTPGNIVFSYTPTKTVAVAKRPWHSPASTSEEINRDFECSPSLQEIIAESERELSESIRNFHNNQRRSQHSSRSPSVSSIGSPSLFNTGLPRPSVQLTSSSLRFQARPIRPRGNPIPFSSTSRPQGKNPALHFPNSCSSESPLPTANRFPNPGFRQPSTNASVSRAYSRYGAGEGKSYMIAGEVAVRQKNNAHSYQNAGENNAQNLGCNPQQSSRQASGFRTNFESPDFEFDFPEGNEDGDLLQFCDEALSNSEDIICEKTNTGTSLNQFGGQPFSPVISNPQSVTNSVIAKVFRDCENENRDTNLENRPMKIFDSADAGSKHSNGKTFTFKRQSPSSFSMNNDMVSNFQSKRKCVMNQESLTAILNQSNGTNLTKSSVKPGMSLPPQEMPGNNENNRNAQGDSERDSRVQLGQKTSSMTKVLPLHTDALSHWDDDLATDELLLSQLSEEF